jgi:hypothetical protein
MPTSIGSDLIKGVAEDDVILVRINQCQDSLVQRAIYIASQSNWRRHIRQRSSII